MYKLLILFFMFSVTAQAEPSTFELKLRLCRNMVDGIEKRLTIFHGTQEQRDDYITALGEDRTVLKELWLDTARQYEYSHNYKWRDAFEFCTDHVDDDIYRK
jgi:hypothetical protein